MSTAKSGKDRARASRLRKKVREGKYLTEAEKIWLDEYNKSVGGVAEDIDTSEETEETEIDNVYFSEEIVEKSTEEVTDEKETEQAPKPTAKRIVPTPIVPVSEPVICKIDGCPCKRVGAGEYCPVLKRRVYPAMDRAMSEIYARGLFKIIKMVLELFPNITGIEPTEDELRTTALAIRELQKQWDKLAAFNSFMSPIFGLLALIDYGKRMVKENKKKALPEISNRE